MGGGCGGCGGCGGGWVGAHCIVLPGQALHEVSGKVIGNLGVYEECEDLTGVRLKVLFQKLSAENVQCIMKEKPLDG